MTEDFKMDIIKEIAVLKESNSGYKKALRLVSWNEAPAKLDLREWTPEGHGTKRGFTMTEEEALALLNGLNQYFNENGSAEKEESEDLPF